MGMSSFLDEFAVANRSESEAGQFTDFGGKPLLVLTADRGNAEGWIADQDALTALSTNSAHPVVPGSTHQSLVDNPRRAARGGSPRRRGRGGLGRTGTPLSRPSARERSPGSSYTCQEGSSATTLRVWESPEGGVRGREHGWGDTSGCTVRRTAGSWTPTVQRLLRHVRDHGIS